MPAPMTWSLRSRRVLCIVIGAIYVHRDRVAARRALKGVVAAGSNGEVQWCFFALRLNDMPTGSRRIRICAKHLDAVGSLYA